MKTVKDILAEKGSDVWSVQVGATVYEALELMADKEIGAVLVMEGDTPVGIFTERDYARKVVLADRSSKSTPVRELMVGDPVCVRPEQELQECMVLMTEGRFRHLPVEKEGKLLGLISIGDVVKATIDEQRFLIEQLKRYITQ
jgi:CBS domain-containing protein